MRSLGKRICRKVSQVRILYPPQNKMKIIFLTKYGNKKCYEYKDTESIKEISSNQIRVQIKYIGLSFTDIIIRKGLYKEQRDNYKLPFCQGFEFSGIVAQVGEKVLNYKVGDEVCGVSKYGCFKEEIVTDENHIFLVPKTYSLKEAAAFPVNYFTAHHAIEDIVRIKEGATILIYGGDGGVGGMLTQISKLKGFKVISIVGNQKEVEYAKSLGADYVFTEDIIANLKKENLKIDVVFDNIGTFNIKLFRNYLSVNSKIIVYGFGSLLNKNIFKTVINYFNLIKIKIFDLVYYNITISGFNIIKLTENLELLGETKNSLENALKEKKIIVPKIEEFDFYKIDDALSYLGDRENYGKVILKIN